MLIVSSPLRLGLSYYRLFPRELFPFSSPLHLRKLRFSQCSIGTLV
jgi:hypothetical protein